MGSHGVKLRLGVHPCLWQLRVIREILKGEEDVVTIAPTGLGKSLTFWAPLLFAEDKVMIVVVPLKTLGTQFATDLNEKFKIPTVMVTKNITDDRLFKDITQLKYRVIIFSPETMVHNPNFESLIGNRQFMRHVLNLTIDEAHTVEQWGSTFRDAYARIGVVRHLMCRHVPIHLASATLPDTLIRKLQAHLNLSAGMCIFRMNIDRPNIFLRVKRMDHPFNSFHDLAPLILSHIPPGGPRPKKFLIFFDSRKLAEEAAAYLRRRLPFEERSRVKWIHAGMTDDFRNEEIHALKVGDVDGECATEAVGLGINIRDVYQVLQYGVPQSALTWAQRLGRAVRDTELKGAAILLAEPSHFDDIKEATARKQEEAHRKREEAARLQRQAMEMAIAAGKELNGSVSQPGSKRKSNKSHQAVKPKQQKHLGVTSTTSAASELQSETDIFGRPIKIDRAMDNFVNAERRGERCRRKVLLHHLGNDKADPAILRLTQHCCARCKPRVISHCCDICTPDYWKINTSDSFDKSTQSRMFHPDEYNRGEKEKELQERLEELREELWADKLKVNGNGLLPPEALWTQSLLLRMVDLAHNNKLTTMDQLRKQVVWHYTELLGPRILDIIKEVYSSKQPLPPFVNTPLQRRQFGTDLTHTTLPATPSPSLVPDTPTIPKQKRKYTCGICKEAGHRRDKCPRPKIDSENVTPPEASRSSTDMNVARERTAEES